MLPDYPEEKNKVAEAIIDLTKTIIEQRKGVFSTIRQSRYFEGDSMKLVRGDGSMEERRFKKVEASVIVTKEQLEEKGFDLTKQTVLSLAEQMAEKQVGMMLSHLEEVTRNVGNVVDGKGQKFNAEMVFEMLEKVDINFDSNGIPKLPMMISNPSGVDTFRAVLDSLHEDRELKKRYDEIIEAKRKDWNDREGARKLVE